MILLNDLSLDSLVQVIHILLDLEMDIRILIELTLLMQEVQQSQQALVYLVSRKEKVYMENLAQKIIHLNQCPLVHPKPTGSCLTFIRED